MFRFCVPVFLGLWAFYVEKALARRDGGEQFAYLKRRWIELAVPYLAWTVLYIAMFQRSNWSTASVHTIVGGWFGGFGWAGQYYFVVLLQLIVLFPWLRRMATGRRVRADDCLGCLINVISGYLLFRSRIVAAVGYRLFIYWIPFVVAGIALARGRFNGNPRLLTLLAIALLCAAPFESRFAPEAPYFSISVTLASLLLLTAATLGDRKAETKGANPPVQWLARIVGVLGRNTFAIFVANVLMLELIDRVGLKGSLEYLTGPFAPMLVAAVAIAGAMCLGWLLRTVRPGMLVGKV